MIVEQIIRSGKFGIEELKSLQEQHPYFVQNMLGHYDLKKKDLFEKVFDGIFGYEEFLDSLNCFINGDPQGSLKWKFFGKTLKLALEKHLENKNERTR